MHSVGDRFGWPSSDYKECHLKVRNFLQFGSKQPPPSSRKLSQNSDPCCHLLVILLRYVGEEHYFVWKWHLDTCKINILKMGTEHYSEILVTIFQVTWNNMKKTLVFTWIGKVTHHTKCLMCVPGIFILFKRRLVGKWHVHVTNLELSVLC
jgi:hypothetical protein